MGIKEAGMSIGMGGFSANNYEIIKNMVLE
jgi:hypothetical protein